MRPSHRSTEAVPAVWHSLCQMAQLDEPSRRRLWRGLSACPDGQTQTLRLLFARLDHCADMNDLARVLQSTDPIAFCEGLERVVTDRPDLRVSVTRLQELMLGVIDRSGKWKTKMSPELFMVVQRQGGIP